MKASDKICHRVILKNLKDKQAYAKREAFLEGTPRLILGKCENNVQQIWIDDLKTESMNKLKELNSSEKAFCYAKTIITACLKLLPRYGPFIINENMIFFNQHRQIFAWINPEILENHVKIYLPNTPDGELAMIRGIITYLKLWLKCDYNYLADARNLQDLLHKFEILRSKVVDFKPKSPGRQFLANRKNSINLQSQDQNGRFMPQNLLADNKSSKDVTLNKSPGKEQHNLMLNKSLSNKYNNPIKFNHLIPSDNAEKDNLKNKTTQSRNTDQISEKNVQQTDKDFEQHKTFNNVNQLNNKLSVNKSLGVKSGNNYFPNKTTSNRNPIVQYIIQQDGNPNGYGKNKILLQDDQMRQLEREKIRKLKQSSNAIGQELDDLFQSGIEGEGDNEEQKKKIEQQFENLLS